MTTPRQPLATDDYSDQPGGFIQQWYCQPPPNGVSFQVLREEWLEVDGSPGDNRAAPFRRIYEWRPLGPWRRQVLRQRLHRLLHPDLW